MNHFLIRLWHAPKSGFYTTTGNGQFSGCTKKKLESTSQSQTCTPPKRSWSLFGGLLPIWSTYSFLNLGEATTSEKYAQQIDEMHPKLQRLQLAVVNRKGLIALHNDTRPHVTQPTLQKSNELGFEVLPFPPYSPDLLPTDYHFFKHLENFLQGKCFHYQQDAENAF